MVRQTGDTHNSRCRRSERRTRPYGPLGTPDREPGKVADGTLSNPNAASM